MITFESRLVYTFTPAWDNHSHSKRMLHIGGMNAFYSSSVSFEINGGNGEQKMI